MSVLSEQKPVPILVEPGWVPERRSKIEITADEVAPSLRWATALVTKNERRTPDGAVGASANSHGGGATRPVTNEPPGDYSYEEEPF